MKTHLVIPAIFILGLMVSPMMSHEARPIQEFLVKNQFGEKKFNRPKPSPNRGEKFDQK